MKNIYAIIPARSGSERIKKKNIKKFFNKPIIYYPIQTAKKSKIFEKIIVTTDSHKIKKVALEAGADDVIIRPKNLSNNKSLVIETVKHAIKLLEKKNITINFICCIFPTAVLLRKKSLSDSFNIYKKSKYTFLFSSIKFRHPIERSFKIKKNKIAFFKKSKLSENTQKLNMSYHDAGQFYWGTKKNWKNKKNILSNNCGHFPMSELNAIDIDTISDWKIAEAIYKNYLNRKG